MSISKKTVRQLVKLIREGLNICVTCLSLSTDESVSILRRMVRLKKNLLDDIDDLLSVQPYPYPNKSIEDNIILTIKDILGSIDDKIDSCNEYDNIVIFINLSYIYNYLEKVCGLPRGYKSSISTGNTEYPETKIINKITDVRFCTHLLRHLDNEDNSSKILLRKMVKDLYILQELLIETGVKVSFIEKILFRISLLCIQYNYMADKWIERAYMSGLTTKEIVVELYYRLSIGTELLNKYLVNNKMSPYSYRLLNKFKKEIVGYYKF